MKRLRVPDTPMCGTKAGWPALAEITENTGLKVEENSGHVPRVLVRKVLWRSLYYLRSLFHALGVWCVSEATKVGGLLVPESTDEVEQGRVPEPIVSERIDCDGGEMCTSPRCSRAYYVLLCSQFTTPKVAAHKRPHVGEYPI